MAPLKKWKLVGKKAVFESKWLTVEDRSYELPSGKIGENYLHLVRRDFVLIVAYDERNNIVVERQYRRGVDDFVYEIPAGWVNDQEEVGEAGKRELREETGFEGDVMHVSEVYVQPAFSSMKAHVVVIKITSKGEHAQEEDEFIEHEMIDITKVKAMIRTGEIKDMGFLSGFAVAVEYWNDR